MNGGYPLQVLPKDVQLAHNVNRYGQTIILDAIMVEQWNNINTTTETVYVDVAYSLISQPMIYVISQEQIPQMNPNVKINENMTTTMDLTTHSTVNINTGER
jgi:hypothetical protein